MLDLHSSIGEWVTDRPARARVLEALGIDYCCGGKQSLTASCQAKGLDPQTLARILETDVDAAGGDAAADAARMTMTELADHIEHTHHAYVRSELPRLQTLLRKVTAAHGTNHPALHEVLQGFLAFESEMGQHMMKEEQVLFPMIRKLECSTTLPQFHCGSLRNPITMMEQEHDAAGGFLSRARELTHDFTPPPGACNTFRVMLDALRQLELDMHQHVHKENNVLFPRALQREAQLCTTPAR